jgi:hypothetical protein
MITAERLRELVHYCPETGVFTHLQSRGRVRPGIPAGCPSNGYIVIRLDKVLYGAHRLAWLYVHGHFPNADTDHIDGNKSNNRINNLRDVDRSTNLQNQKRASTRNKSTGLLGVNKRENGSFRAYIKINGKIVSLGTFDNAEDAHEAYLSAKREHHKGCTI